MLNLINKNMFLVKYTSKDDWKKTVFPEMPLNVVNLLELT